ncbi:hypothetical protein AB0J47_31570 [Nocardia sp. NPDC049737]|uniref:hypothetical protein n=1 Tax=Nocardia sp. NPDC049737 TaxID=3154358 RepID=UPI00343848A4
MARPRPSVPFDIELGPFQGLTADTPADYNLAKNPIIDEICQRAFDQATSTSVGAWNRMDW